jgi:hypothetical protein
MTQTLADLLPDAAGGTVNLRLWLKSSAYTQRLLLGEAGDPWESASKFLAYFSQAQGLLKPDVAIIEVGELFDSWLRRNPELKPELVAKRKLAYPLRKLLEQAPARALLSEVIEAVDAHLRGRVPLVLAMPSPRYWMRLANRAAGREDAELDDNNIEDSAMYIADLLRSVSSLPVGGVLLEEERSGSSVSPVDVDLYRPLINVAKHYRWPLALRIGSDRLFDSPTLKDFDIYIGKANLPAAGRARGLDVSDQVWSDGLPDLKPAEFYFVEIAPDILPEHVLDCLSGVSA